MGRVVVVTGASQGIGLATALAFARAGDTVVATSRNPASITIPADVGAGAIEAVALDHTDGGSVDHLAAEVLGRHGRVDVVVNNAGRGFVGTTEELAIDDLRESLEVNFLGVVRVTKAFLPHMREAGRGHLIAVTSIGGAVGQPFNDAYCAAKFAVEGLYESLHPIAALSGVSVTVIQPGPVVSDHGNRAFHAAGHPAYAPSRARQRAAYAAAEGQPAEEVAKVILQAADDPQPHARYQSSTFVERVVGKKLKDLTGDATTSMTRSWIAG